MDINRKYLTLAFAALLSAPSMSASAGSWVIPGATTGNPAGALPPPGLYFANTVYYGSGVGVSSGGESPFFVWVPGWNILGASYGAAVGFPSMAVGIETPGHKADAYLKGAFNPYINPITLSWSLGSGFFLALGESTYVPVNTEVVNPPSEGRSGTAFETSLNISYLANGWIISANNILGITTQGAGGYKTANYFNSDWTLVHKFGDWKLGAIGFGAWDLQSVPLVPGSSFRTTPAVQVGIGGLLSYNFGPMEAVLRVTHQLITKGTFPDSGRGDTRVWATALIPIWTPSPEAHSKQLIAK